MIKMFLFEYKSILTEWKYILILWTKCDIIKIYFIEYKFVLIEWKCIFISYEFLFLQHFSNHNKKLLITDINLETANFPNEKCRYQSNHHSLATIKVAEIRYRFSKYTFWRRKCDFSGINIKYVLLSLASSNIY